MFLEAIYTGPSFTFFRKAKQASIRQFIHDSGSNIGILASYSY